MRSLGKLENLNTIKLSLNRSITAKGLAHLKTIPQYMSRILITYSTQPGQRLTVRGTMVYSPYLAKDIFRDWKAEIPLEQTGPTTWVLCPKIYGKVAYKILCDGVWETGPNHVISSGKTVRRTPTFPTTVRVTHTAPPNSTLSLRGEWPGAHWDKDIPLTQVRPGIWETTLEHPLGPFKILRNGQWEQGDNHHANTGRVNTVSPIFFE